jgi:ankyrin repeat protein
VNWELMGLVEVLRFTHDRLKARPGYPAELDAIHLAIRQRHEDPSGKDPVYGWNTFEVYPKELFEGEDALSYWPVSFWVRRQSEGNVDAVREILDRIAAHYAGDAAAIAKLASQKAQQDKDDHLRERAGFLFLDQMGSAVENGARPEAMVGVKGITALQATVFSDDAAQVEQAVAAGADLHALDEFGCSAMHYARTPAMVRLLARLGAKVDGDGTCRGGYQKDFSPLMFAINNQKPELALALLEAGAGVGPRPETGTTPLMLASYRSPELVKPLLERGADPNAVDPRGENVLLWAARSASPALIASLIEAGAVADEQTLERARKAKARPEVLALFKAAAAPRPDASFPASTASDAAVPGAADAGAPD